MDYEDHVGLPFVTLAFGWFGPDQVEVSYDAKPRETTPELEKLIAVEWERQLAAAKVAGRVLFDGALLRYVSHEILPASTQAPERFRLTVGPTCYRDFVGTNLFNRHRLGDFAWYLFANPIGTTATLLTRDDMICYGRRSHRVAYHGGYIHTFGGALEREDRMPDGSIDPFGSVRRELREELGIEPAEVQNLSCVGLIRDQEIHQPELLFEGQLTFTAAEMKDRWRTAESADEHDALVAVPNDPSAIFDFIEGCDLIAPVAVGALCLHGQRRWGGDWQAPYAEAWARRTDAARG